MGPTHISVEKTAREGTRKSAKLLTPRDRNLPPSDDVTKRLYTPVFPTAWSQSSQHAKAYVVYSYIQGMTKTGTCIKIEIHRVSLRSNTALVGCKAKKDENESLARCQKRSQEDASYDLHPAAAT